MIILDQQELRRLVGILSGLQKISWSFKDKSTECGPRAFSLKIRWRENLKLNLHHSFLKSPTSFSLDQSVFKATTRPRWRKSRNPFSPYSTASSPSPSSLSSLYSTNSLHRSSSLCAAAVESPPSLPSKSQELLDYIHKTRPSICGFVPANSGSPTKHSTVWTHQLYRLPQHYSTSKGLLDHRFLFCSIH